VGLPGWAFEWPGPRRGLYPHGADGTAFREGFIPLIKASGYKPVDGGAYTDGTTDFTSMISKPGDPAPLGRQAPPSRSAGAIAG
jgi:hypothetical protein